MRILLVLLGVYLALVIHGQAAMAAAPQNILPVPATPVIIEADAHADIPSRFVSTWEVEAFVRENGFPTGECVMRASYDNDLEVTFKGKNGQLSAVRLYDLNGAQGSEVNGFISLGLANNSYGLQSRSVQGQIDASLLTVPAVAEKIMDLGQYRLRVGAQDYKFDVGGFAYAYHDLLKCTGYENVKTLKVVNEAAGRSRRITNKTVMVPSLPTEPVDLIVEQDLIAVDTRVSDVNQAVKLDVIDEDLLTHMDAWSANKGDTLSTVLKDWALKAGVKPEIDLSNEVILEKDIRVFGALDIAVGQLLKEAYGKSSPLAVLKGQDGALTKISELAIQPTVLAAKPQNLLPTGNWRVLQGMDLKKILKRWSIREGVDFVWDADQTFLLKKTTKPITDYNSAVAMLLEQYKDQDVKPIGALNVDPNTGKKTLIISVSGAS